MEKSGYFVLPPHSGAIPAPEKYGHSLAVQPSVPNAYTGKIIAISMQQDILPFGAAIPHASILPLSRFTKITTALTRKKPHLLCQYAPPDGSPALRRQIARLMVDRGVTVAVDDILVTNGCTEALAFAIRCATKKGDTIAVESPAYFGLLTLLARYDRKVVEIPASATDGLDPQVLQSVAAEVEIAACICSPNFQNPLGSMMGMEKKQELLRICDSLNITLIEDDIYGECSFDDHVTSPLKQLDSKGNVIYCSSFSKTVNPGCRIGWIIAGKCHTDCRELKFAESLGGPVLLQQAMADFLNEGGYHYHMRNFRKRIARQSHQMKEMLMKYLPESVKISSPAGGFFLWLELPSEVDAISLFHDALIEKIGLVPGPVFSCQEDMFTNCIRLSCGSPVTEKAEHGIVKLGEIIEQHTKAKGTHRLLH